MVAVKVVLILLLIVSGGAVTLRETRDYLDRHKGVRAAALGVAVIGGVYLCAGLFVDIDHLMTWTYQRITIGRYIDRNYSIAACDQQLDEDCVRYGGAYGDSSSLDRMRECGHLQVLASSSLSLEWTSL